MSERQFAMNPGDNTWFSIKTILVVNVWVSIMLYVCAVNGHKLYIYCEYERQRLLGFGFFQNCIPDDIGLLLYIGRGCM